MDFQLALNKTELLYEVCAHAYDELVSIATPTPLPSFLTSFFILFSRTFRPAIPRFRALQLATAAARRAFRPVAFSRANPSRLRGGDRIWERAFRASAHAPPSPKRRKAGLVRARRKLPLPAGVARAASLRERRGSQSRRFWNPLRARASAICQSVRGLFRVCPSVNAARLPAAPRRALGGFERAFDPGLRGSPSEVARARLGSICRTIRGARAGERPRTWCCRLGR